MKVIVSLETPKHFLVAEKIQDYVDGWKINHIGYSIADRERSHDWWSRLERFRLAHKKELFVDFKLWDTPNTMKMVIEHILKMGATMTTISTFNNPSALAAAAEYKDDLKLLGVTYLTSWSDAELYQVSRELEPLMWRRHIERMLKHEFAGVISSAHDIHYIREWGDPDHKLLNVCPGITVETPDGEPFHSGQVRTTSVPEAEKLGADCIILGRAVTESHAPLLTIKTML